MRIIVNISQANDDEIISVMDDCYRIVTRGHWFNDNILAFTNKDGFVKEGYSFFIQDDPI